MFALRNLSPTNGRNITNTIPQRDRACDAISSSRSSTVMRSSPPRVNVTPIDCRLIFLTMLRDNRLYDSLIDKRNIHFVFFPFSLRSVVNDTANQRAQQKREKQYSWERGEMENRTRRNFPMYFRSAILHHQWIRIFQLFRFALSYLDDISFFLVLSKMRGRER